MESRWEGGLASLIENPIMIGRQTIWQASLDESQPQCILMIFGSRESFVPFIP